MQTHDDKDAMEAKFREEIFLKKLEERAGKMKERKMSEITAGKENEPIIAQWRAHGMQVTVRPDDEQGILRISVGGGDKTPVPLNYCTVRGDIGACIKLLERAIRALRGDAT